MIALQPRLQAIATLLLSLLTLLMAAPAAAQEFPARPEGPVLDAAGVLPAAQEAALDQRLRAYNQETGRAIIVATVPSLGGETIEGYAVELYEQWGIGGEETDMGALLLVAPEEREVRIEVGYGLTPYLTDVMSGRIIRNQIIPQFRQGDMAAGILAGVDGIVETLSMDPADARAVAEAEAAAAQRERRVDGSTIGSAVFWVGMILLFMFIFGRRGGRRHRRYGMGGTVGNILLWHAVGSALGAASRGSGSGGFGGFSGGGGGGFGGFGGGMSGGGGASGSW